MNEHVAYKRLRHLPIHDFFKQLKTEQVEKKETSTEENKAGKFVAALELVIKALSANDYEKFETYFTKNTVGMQPNELWPAAKGVLTKFGNVKRLEFSQLEGEGAFVKMHFEQATREVFIRLDEQNKIRELTYVPPAEAHK